MKIDAYFLEEAKIIVTRWQNQAGTMLDSPAYDSLVVEIAKGLVEAACGGGMDSDLFQKAIKTEW